MSAPSVCIVILNWNGEEILQTCLRSIRAHTSHPRTNILVVDNGSTDDSVHMIREDFPNVEVIETGTNLGFSKGCNVGMQYVMEKYDPDYILLMNNDIEVKTDGWLEVFIEIAKSNGAGVAGCELVYPDGEIQCCGAIADWRGARLLSDNCSKEPRNLSSNEFVYGACSLIDSTTISEIGYLDEGFKPYNWEDSDYCMRCHAADITMVYSPVPTLVHHTGKSKEAIPDTEHIYINKKNQLRFYLLNNSLPKLVARLPYEIANFKQAILGTEEYEHTNSMWERLSTFIRAYGNVLRQLPDIISKRRDRTQRITPGQRDV